MINLITQEMSANIIKTVKIAPIIVLILFLHQFFIHSQSFDMIIYYLRRDLKNLYIYSVFWIIFQALSSQSSSTSLILLSDQPVHKNLSSRGKEIIKVPSSLFFFLSSRII